MPLNQAQIALLEVDEETRRDVRAVHAFLKANQTLAFSPEEVAQALHQDADLVEHIFHKFDDLDLVTMRFKDEIVYVRYLADLPEL
ncbi:MAG: hypothetical protein AB7P33_08845 [Dehalococcoidia bacterium]